MTIASQRYLTRCMQTCFPIGHTFTLLHFVDGELKDVAKGTIIQPARTIMHHKEMVDAVFKVWLARVLPGCKDMDPPPNRKAPRNIRTLRVASAGS
jgi:hypothetical protein